MHKLASLQIRGQAIDVNHEPAEPRRAIAKGIMPSKFGQLFQPFEVDCVEQRDLSRYQEMKKWQAAVDCVCVVLD